MSFLIKYDNDTGNLELSDWDELTQWIQSQVNFYRVIRDSFSHARNNNRFELNSIYQILDLYFQNIAHISADLHNARKSNNGEIVDIINNEISKGTFWPTNSKHIQSYADDDNNKKIKCKKQTFY